MKNLKIKVPVTKTDDHDFFHELEWVFAKLRMSVRYMDDESFGRHGSRIDDTLLLAESQFSEIALVLEEKGIRIRCVYESDECIYRRGKLLEVIVEKAEGR